MHWGGMHYSRHPFLDVEAAKNIMARGVRVIGVDTMSPDNVTENGDAGVCHRQILGNGGIVVENLRGLEDVTFPMRVPVTMVVVAHELALSQGPR